MISDLKPLRDYILTIEKQLVAGNATEHTHRPALKALIEGLASGVTAVNEPRRIDCGAPDFVVTKGALTIGYVEAKDTGKSLDETEKTEQLKRYLPSLSNLILTDYLEFRWYVNGERRLSARLGTLPAESKVKRDNAGIQAVKNMGKHVEVAYFESGLAKDLLNVADNRYLLNRSFFSGLWAHKRYINPRRVIGEGQK